MCIRDRVIATHDPLVFEHVEASQILTLAYGRLVADTAAVAPMPADAPAGMPSAVSIADTMSGAGPIGAVA